MKLSGTLLLLGLVLGLGAWIGLHERHQLSSAEKAERRRRAFEVDVDRLNLLGLRGPDYEVELNRQGSSWLFTHPRGALAHGPTVRQILSRLRGLDRGELITPSDMRERGLTLWDFGLVTPRLVLRLGEGDKRREYRIGDLNPLRKSLYVREESSQNVMLVSSDLLDILPQTPEAFRERRLFPFEARDIRAIGFSSKGAPVRIERRKGTWAFAEPSWLNADDAKVEEVLNLLLTASAEDFVPEETPSTVSGLEASSPWIRVHLGGREVPHEIRIGGAVENEPALLYAAIVGQEGTLKVSRGLAALAGSRVADLRDRRLLPLGSDGVRGIRVRKGDRQLSLARAGEGGWWVREPVEKPADSVRVGRMLERWTGMRVREFMEGRAAGPQSVEIEFLAETAPPGVPLRFELLFWDPSDGCTVLRPLPATDTPPSSAEPELWRVEGDLFDLAPLDPLAYLSREVLRFDPAKVIRVTLKDAGDTRVVVRESPEAGWLTETPGHVVDADSLLQLLSVASRLNAVELLALGPASLLDPSSGTPEISLSFGFLDGQPANRTLLFFRSDNGMVAMVQGDDLLFRLEDAVAERLLAPWSKEARPPVEEMEPDVTPPQIP